MPKIFKSYQKLECVPLNFVPEPLMADSVNNEMTVSSVGQVIDVDVTFENDSFPNISWESDN